MKKEINYKYFQELIKDKDKSVNYFIQQTLNKTQSMFLYNNLPPTIPQSELENLLQSNGFAFVTKVNEKLYAFVGGLGGVLNEYYKPTKIIISNPYLNLNKEYDLKTDGVLIKNDYFCNGLLNIIGKYAVLLTDCNISLNLAAVLTRLTILMTASDDGTKKSCELYLEKILNGDFSVIAENAFLKGVQIQNANNNTQNNITQLIELTQYYKANLLNEIGLNSNFNMKRERLNETELLLNSDDLLPFINQMLFCRQTAIKEINEKYGLNIQVDLNTSWKTEKELNENTTENVETVTNEEIILNTPENPENVTRETENENPENVTRETENENPENVTRETENENKENEKK